MINKYVKEEVYSCIAFIQKFKFGYAGLFKASSSNKGSLSVGVAEGEDKNYYLVLKQFMHITFTTYLFQVFLSKPNYNEVQEKLEEFLNTLPDGSNLIITGHSKAATACSHFAIWAKITFEDKFNLKTYAIGPSSTEDITVKKNAEGSCNNGYFSIVNPMDPFPYLYGNIESIIDKKEALSLPLVYANGLSMLSALLKIKGTYMEIGKKISLPTKDFPIYKFSYWQQILYFEFLAKENHSLIYYKLLLNDQDEMSTLDWLE